MKATPATTHKKSSVEKEVKENSFPIVAIGASAGGLEAITELLNNLPSDTGMSFIYVQHLSPDHKSMLTEILSKQTKMKVQEIDDMDKIKPDNVFIIPQNKGIEVTDGHIKLVPRAGNSSAISIDILFSSLAHAQKERVIGIILSGSASDGTLGMKAIKYEGGLTFAQDKTAKFASMPQNAIAAGVVDFILSPREIALELSRLSKHLFIKSNGRKNPASKRKKRSKEDLIDNNNPHLKIILDHLRKATGVDFSQYKMTTIKRRIIRRMLLYKIETLKKYAKYLDKKNEEIDILYQDLLINVTSFFRDTDTHKFLKENLFPKLLKRKKTGEPLRIWVPACASGEEVYSLAMILLEIQGSEDNIKIPIQIFATDLSEQAISTARIGIYSKQELETVSPKRIQRFFTKADGGYRVNKSVRDLCVFAQHNILTDPPFSRLDFISCCNLFIYFDTAAQKKAVSTFHYALNEDGFLMLGKSESISKSAHLFTGINKKYKIFSRKINSVAHTFPQLSQRFANQILAEKNIVAGNKKTMRQSNNSTIGQLNNVDSAIDALLLSEFMPASVTINHQMEIVQFRGATDLFLTHPKGRANLNILKMAKLEIAFELRIAILKAIKTRKRVKIGGIEIKTNAATQIISLEVVPLQIQSDEPLLLILFTEHTQALIFSSSDKKGKSNSVAAERRIKKLEEELAAAHADALAFAQEQEAYTEELQSVSEEVVSSNEELQTVNEELETSKEEIESANEELSTTNQELQMRHEELKKSEERYHLMISEVQDYAIILLSKDGIIENWNKGAENIKGYKAEEIIGKYFSVFYTEEDRQTYLPEKLLKEATKNSKATHEGWRVRKDGSKFWGSIVITALHNEQKNIIGFSKVTRDLTERKLTDDKIKLNAATLEQKNIELENKTIQLEEAQQLAHIGSWEWDVATNKIEWSDELYRIYGLVPQEFKADYENFLKYIHPDDREYVNGIVQQAFKDHQPFNFIHKVVHPDGTERVVSSTGKVFTDGNGNTIRMAGTAQDVTAQKKYEAELEESEERFIKIFDHNPVPMTLTEIKSNKIKYANKLFYEAFGYSEQEVIGNTSEELNLIDPEENQRLITLIFSLLQETRPLAEVQSLSVEETEELLIKLKESDAMKNLEVLYTRKNGETFPAVVSFEIMRFGSERYTIASYQDITDRKKAEEQLAEQKAFAELLIENDPAMILAYDENLHIIAWNKKSEEGTGFKKEEVLGKHPFDVFPEYNNEQWKGAFNSVLKEGKVIHYSGVPFKRINGYGEFWLVPLRNTKQQIVGILSITRDISETIKMTGVLEQKNAELLKMNKELESFAYISSHDLQEPLRKIQTFATRITAKEENNLSENGKDMFNRMQDAAKRMQTLIQDLLVYSRTSTSERKLETTDLNKIIAEVKEDLKEELKEKHATIEANQLCDADIIPFQFRQLMHNLIGNSLKFSNPENPPHIQIKSEIVKGIKLNNAKLSPEKKYCHISVTDNGIGFEPQYSEKIFEVFQRLHVKNEYNGTGIGLSIVKKIVENHNGIITANGELNKGATFEIYIPAS